MLCTQFSSQSKIMITMHAVLNTNADMFSINFVNKFALNSQSVQYVSQKILDK